MLRAQKLFLLFALVMLLVPTGCGTTDVANDQMAVIKKIENGQAMLKRAEASEFVPVEVNVKLFEGDTIKTPEKTEVLLRFSTGAVTRIMPNTEFHLKKQEYVKADQTTVFTRLVKGIAYFYVPKGNDGYKKFQVETKRAIASIKGTTFKVEETEDASTLTVGEGVVAFMTKDSNQPTDVEAFFTATVNKDGMQPLAKANTLSDPYLADAKIEYFSK